MATVAITQHEQNIEEAITEALGHLPLEALVRGKLAAVKNIAMSYPAADYDGHPRANQQRPHHFFEDIHSFIAAMAKRFPISLAVTVGHPAMLGTGPLGGHVVETGLVLASDDALDPDLVGARLLGFNIQGVRQLWEAGRLGVGESRLGAMQFPAMSLREAVEAFTTAVYGRRLTFEHA